MFIVKSYFCFILVQCMLHNSTWYCSITVSAPSNPRLPIDYMQKMKIGAKCGGQGFRQRAGTMGVDVSSVLDGNSPQAPLPHTLLSRYWEKAHKMPALFKHSLAETRLFSAFDIDKKKLCNKDQTIFESS